MEKETYIIEFLKGGENDYQAIVQTATNNGTYIVAVSKEQLITKLSDYLIHRID
ncbi:MAG: hypothetical protein J6X18_13720 [Bacteroidales bacterium]|nr:hypothetical protein [Bacteroidales bacterium]